jgi:hypothetical protein
MTITTQERVEQARRNLADRLEVLKLWEHEVWQKPGNQQAAAQLEHVKRMVEDAKKQLKQAEEAAALAADPTHPKAKAELKELDQINKDGSKLMDDITKAAIALDGQIQELMTLQRQANKLAMKYDKRPWYSGIAINRIQTMGHAITRWRQEIKSWGE